MISEQQRRDYLSAMQIDCWLPRVELPFAAPSYLDWQLPKTEDVTAIAALEPAVVVRASATAEDSAVVNLPAPQSRVEIPRPVAKAAMAAEVDTTPVEPVKAQEPPPRFSLQLLRAGNCLLLVDLPNGESFQRRDPAYLLLRDLLRAAQLPDSPQQVGDGEPIRWPLLRNSSALEQGREAARDYVQAVVAGVGPSSCLWLVGEAALRFAGERDEQAYNQTFAVEELGRVWALPGLELLMAEPQRKASLWQAMRRLIPSWSTQVE